LRGVEVAEVSGEGSIQGKAEMSPQHIQQKTLKAVMLMCRKR
jgi:hypothetical protein